MSQKIKLVALVKYRQKILLIKSSKGNYLPFTDFPSHLEPEDRLNQYIQKKISVVPEEIKTLRVIRDQDDIIIVYQVNISKEDYLKIYERDNFIWKQPNQIDQSELDQLSLKILSRQDIVVPKADDEVELKHRFVLFTDGGSRGNPGHSAIGYAIFDDGKKLFERGEYIGITNSAIAEYQALARGIEAAAEMGISQLECRVDNLMIVRQMNSQYQVKNRELWPINQRINNLAKRFNRIKYVHIKREFNQIADSLVNKALDEYLLQTRR